jgi:hypothetical protein
MAKIQAGQQEFKQGHIILSRISKIQAGEVYLIW